MAGPPPSWPPTPRFSSEPLSSRCLHPAVLNPSQPCRRSPPRDTRRNLGRADAPKESGISYSAVGFSNSREFQSCVALVSLIAPRDPWQIPSFRDRPRRDVPLRRQGGYVPGGLVVEKKQA